MQLRLRNGAQNEAHIAFDMKNHVSASSTGSEHQNYANTPPGKCHLIQGQLRDSLQKDASDAGWVLAEGKEETVLGGDGWKCQVTYIIGLAHSPRPRCTIFYPHPSTFSPPNSLSFTDSAPWSRLRHVRLIKVRRFYMEGNWVYATVFGKLEYLIWVGYRRLYFSSKAGFWTLSISPGCIHGLRKCLLWNGKIQKEGSNN